MVTDNPAAQCVPYGTIRKNHMHAPEHELIIFKTQQHKLLRDNILILLRLQTQILRFFQTLAYPLPKPVIHHTTQLSNHNNSFKE